MHDLLFANQGTPDGLKRAALDGYAKELGLDASRFANALDHGTQKSTVRATPTPPTTPRITGTPTFLINGYVVSGAQSFARFRRVIDRALEEGR